MVQALSACVAAPSGRYPAGHSVSHLESDIVFQRVALIYLGNTIYDFFMVLS